MVTLPTMWLGVASLTWELLTALWRYVVQGGGVELCRAGLTALGSPAPPRWTQVRGWLRKFCTAVQLFIFGTATVALFVISLVGSTWGGGWGLEGHH